MNITKWFPVIALAISMSLAYANDASASSIGRSYFIFLDSPSGLVTGFRDFGSPPSVIAGLNFHETATPLGDNLELLEFAFETTNGAPFNSITLSPITLNIFGPNWADGENLSNVENSYFTYYTIDGDAQSMTDNFPSASLSILPHPLDNSTQVLYPGPQVINPSPNLNIFGELGLFGTSLTQVELYDILGLSNVANDINGFRFGLIVDYEPVPEPSTFVLASLGLLGFVFAARRKNKKV